MASRATRLNPGPFAVRMPVHLRIPWVVTLVTFVVSAAISPAYETGARTYTTPVLHLGVAACLVAFARRREWSWQIVFWGSLAAVIINVVFFPSEKFYGGMTFVARGVVSLQALACLGTFLSMQSSATKQWFRGASMHERQPPGSDG